MPVLTAGLVAATASGIAALYPGPLERLQYAATLGGSAATRAFNGRGYGLETTGGITAYGVGFLGQLVLPVLAIALTVRHTRREEVGRAELVAAAPVGRLAPLAAAGLPGTGSAWSAVSLTFCS